MLDLVIRDGLICDGSGRPPFRGSLGIRGRRIVSLGGIREAAEREIDATDRVVSPGFVDPHTHFDAQLAWDGFAQPSLEHGVTTVIPGNCSLSLAPLRAGHRELLGAIFRQIEELPKAAFDAGLEWRWETFEEYVGALRPGLGINVAPLVGHSLLRLWVMGEEARERAATADEVAQMQDVLRASLAAGAIGMSTSWVDVDHEHRPVPCRHALHDELRALCRTLGETGAMLQVVPEFYAADLLCARIDILAELSLECGIPTTFSPLFESLATPSLVGRALERIEKQAARGARVIPQMQTRPIDVSFDLSEPSIPFASKPTWWQVLAGPEQRRLEQLRDPETRAALVAETRNGIDPIALKVDFAQIRVRGVERPENAELVGRTLGEIAAERGGDPVEVMIDLSLDEGLKSCFVASDIGHRDSEKIGPRLAHPHVQIGAGDGGAHVSRFATYGDTGRLFGEFVRRRGDLSLEQAVRKLSHEICLAWGIHDRGLLQPGFAADVVVFDPQSIDRGPEEPVRDLPGEAGFRYVRRARGVEHVIVNGAPTYSASGGYSGARAGEIVPRSAPGTL